MARLASRGSELLQSKGEHYATRAPCAPVFLRSGSRLNGVSTMVSLSDAILASTEHEFSISRPEQT
jgi:hypothetical protein